MSQSPQQISYQGVARNASGAVLSNTTIAVKFDIHQGSALGSVVFSEQHQGATALTTNAFGLFSTGIGSINNLNTVSWANGPFFVEVLIDPSNGTSYNSVGTQQLMSVPYALYAEKAGNASPTPTITINAPNTITNLATGSYSINIPAATSFSAGNGISVINGVITNTLPAITPTLDVVGGILTGTYPTHTLTIPSSTTNLVQGDNIFINKSGNTYTISTVTPTLNVTGGTLTGTYPTQTLTIPNSTTTLVSANTNLQLTPGANTYTLDVASYSLTVNSNTLTLSNGSSSTTATIPAGSINGITTGGVATLTTSANSFTLNVPTPTLNVTGGSLTGSYPLQTLTIPSSSTTLTQGNNVTLNQVGNTYTVSSVTPTLNVTGGSLTGSYPLQTLTIPSSSTTLTQGNNVTLNQVGNTYTVSSVTPTLNVTGGSLTGSYPLQTLTIPSSSTTLAQGNNVTLNQVGNTYTVSSVTPTLNVTGGSLTGTYPLQTLTIPSSSTTLVQGNNVTLNQAGNTYTISTLTPTLTAGANVTITPVGASNVYTITAGTTSYTGTAGNVAVTGNTINLVQTGVVAGTYGSNASNAVPTFSVDNFGRLISAAQYTPTILGDVIGTVNTSTVSKLRGVPIVTLAPTNGQVLQYNGAAWIPTTLTTNWSITGNAGTTAFNFIGSTDNAPFRIKTNGIERAWFSINNNLILFAGDNTNPGSLAMNGEVSNTIRVLETVSNTNGSALSIIAGDSKTGSSNGYGGTLNLTSGASTGSGSSTIDFYTATPGASGATRSTPALKMRLTENGQLLIGNTTGFSPTSKLIVFDGHIESAQTTAPAIAGAGSLLGLVGSSAALSSNSTDVCGTISINIGLLGGAKGTYAAVTFNKTYANPPVIILTPRSEGAANLAAYVTGTTATGFSLAFSSGTAGLTTYEFNYMIIESN